jgi:hypothetical protein
MRRQYTRHHRHRGETPQYDLFESADSEQQKRPQWDALPTQTRQELTDLMARLILDHREKGRNPLKREGRHD